MIYTSIQTVSAKALTALEGLLCSKNSGMDFLGKKCHNKTATVFFK